MDFYGQIFINGLMVSGFYAIMAVGLSLVFGVMNTANFAHGEFFMLGAYAVWLLYTLQGWPFFTVVLLATLVIGLLGMLVERVLFRRVHGNILDSFIISLGLVSIIQVLVGQGWGVGRAKPVPLPYPGSLAVFGITIPWQRLIILPAVVLLLGGLFLFLSRARLGRGLRACALDSEAASLQGISANTSALIALGVGSAMAGAAGALMAPIMLVFPYMGNVVIWTCFVVVIVGGAGNLKGTILASCLFGFLYSIVSSLLDPVIANIIACLVMAIFLSIRPQGLVGYAET